MKSDTSAIELFERLAKTWAAWIGLDGDRDQYKRMSQYAADGVKALREVERARDELAEAKAERDGLAAHVERLREALATIESEVSTISEGKQEEVRNDVSSGEALGWLAAHDHIGPIIFAALTAPATDWLSTHDAAIREPLEREVAALRDVLVQGHDDRWAATVGNTETNAFAKCEWVAAAEKAIVDTAATAKRYETQMREKVLREAAARAEKETEDENGEDTSFFYGIVTADTLREWADDAAKEATNEDQS